MSDIDSVVAALKIHTKNQTKKSLLKTGHPN